MTQYPLQRTRRWLQRQLRNQRRSSRLSTMMAQAPAAKKIMSMPSADYVAMSLPVDPPSPPAKKQSTRSLSAKTPGTTAKSGVRRHKGNWNISSFQVDRIDGKSRFHDFDLPLSLMRAIAELGFEYCTPIQVKALPDALAGKDLVGKASTGTGKTAVFLIALLTKLLQEKRSPRPGTPQALIIAPTRELVMQIAKDGHLLAKYTPFRILAVYGGTDYQGQIRRLEKGRADIVVATPGRLLDFVGKKVVRLHQVRTMIIDEADRMLDMGFIPDVRRIIGRTPKKQDRQTMLFSATITSDVKRLAEQWCVNPISLETELEQMTVDTVDQIVYMTTTAEKYNVLYNTIISGKHERIIVFTNMKSEAKKLYERLRGNDIQCALLTGDVPQQKRMARLESFRAGRVEVMIATDVAGRGIHIDGISHVFNYTLPYEPEDYVHRIGRTGRAGNSGISISFADEEGAFYLPEIEEFIGRSLPCVQPEEELLVQPPPGHAPKHPVRRGGRKRRRR